MSWLIWWFVVDASTIALEGHTGLEKPLAVGSRRHRFAYLVPSVFDLRAMPECRMNLNLVVWFLSLVSSVMRFCPQKTANEKE